MYAVPKYRKAHIQRYHTIEGHQQQRREEMYWKKLLTAEAGIVVDHDYEARVDHCAEGRAVGRFNSRIDFLVHHLALGRVFYVEIDEDSHSGQQSCDFARMNSVYTTLQRPDSQYRGQPVLFIRLNPNSFVAFGQKRNPSRSERFRALMDFMQQTAPRSNLSIKYMFFSTRDGVKPRFLENTALLQDDRVKPLLSGIIPGVVV